MKWTIELKRSFTDTNNKYMIKHLQGDYYKVNLNYDKVVHQVVALAFHRYPPSNKQTVDHIDRIPENNYPSNLQYAIQSEKLYNQNKPENIKVNEIQGFNIKTDTIIGEFESIKKAVQKFYYKSFTIFVGLPK